VGLDRGEGVLSPTTHPATSPVFTDHWLPSQRLVQPGGLLSSLYLVFSASHAGCPDIPSTIFASHLLYSNHSIRRTPSMGTIWVAVSNHIPPQATFAFALPLLFLRAQ